jgi:hypothetical protein
VGYIDAKGRVVVKPRFGVPKPEAEIGSFSEGLAAVLIGGKTGFIDSKGKIVIQAAFPPWRTSAPRFLSGAAQVEAANGGARHVDRNGKTFDVPPFLDFEEKLVPFKSASGSWGYANARGETIIPPLFDAALPFHEGKAVVKRDNRWWYIAQPQF